MKQILGAFRRTTFGTAAALFLLAVAAVALPQQQASAAGLLYRSLEITSSQPSGLNLNGAGEVPADAGEAANGDKVGHTYYYQARTGGNLGALTFSYCDSAFGYLEMGVGESCALGAGDLTGFDASLAPSAVIYAVTPGVGEDSPQEVASWGTADATFTVDAGDTDSNFLEVNGTPFAVTANQFVKVVFAPTSSNYFTNPSTTNTTFFAHINTFSDTAATTGVDEGTVASSTANTISIATRVSEVLKFSVEGESEETPDGPTVAEGTCDPLTGSGAVVMGDRNNSNSLATNRTYDAYSYFRMATNSSKGAQVLYAGETLKSTAGDEIDALTATPTNPAANTEQFGLAVAVDLAGNDVKDVTTVGSDLVAAADYADGLAGFDGGSPNLANGDYAFDTTSNGVPVLLASAPDVVSCDTGAVRYIANISNDTPAGLYSTKVSYIAVPSY